MTMRDFRVVQVNIAGMTGYQIQALWRMCSDSFWETVVHDAVFPDQDRAQRFLERVKRRPSWKINGAHWGKPVDSVSNAADCWVGGVNAYTVI